MEITLAWTSVLYAYLTLHVLYGLVTHWHSVLQVNKFNENMENIKLSVNKVTIGCQLMFFAVRMLIGLPLSLCYALWAWVLSPIFLFKFRSVQIWHYDPKAMKEVCDNMNNNCCPY